ncbi:LEPR-XLL domain-containing protein [Planomicrobium sp. CPCC 101110]|nr:LEPR-XLL domain-containing protein [Planomicrobium sp. CPCC 101110]
MPIVQEVRLEPRTLLSADPALAQSPSASRRSLRSCPR